jgi:hypothetical protein
MEIALQALLDAQTVDLDVDHEESADESYSESTGEIEDERESEECDIVREPLPKKPRRSPVPSEVSGSSDEEQLEPAISLDNPPNFSRVDTSASPETIQSSFPLYAEALGRAGLTVKLSAGEMLYLPAGWFHEVVSTGPPPLGHMAINYWFHPPDRVYFEKPYSTDFWENEWKTRQPH